MSDIIDEETFLRGDILLEKAEHILKEYDSSGVDYIYDLSVNRLRKLIKLDAPDIILANEVFMVAYRMLAVFLNQRRHNSNIDLKKPWETN